MRHVLVHHLWCHEHADSGRLWPQPARASGAQACRDTTQANLVREHEATHAEASCRPRALHLLHFQIFPQEFHHRRKSLVFRLRPCPFMTPRPTFPPPTPLPTILRPCITTSFDAHSPCSTSTPRHARLNSMRAQRQVCHQPRRRLLTGNCRTHSLNVSPFSRTLSTHSTHILSTLSQRQSILSTSVTPAPHCRPSLQSGRLSRYAWGPHGLGVAMRSFCLSLGRPAVE